MGIGAGASVLMSTRSAAGLSSAAEEISDTDTSFDFNINDAVIEGHDIVVRIYYEGDSEPELTVTTPNSEEYTLVPYDFDKTQDENNEAGANTLARELTNKETNAKEKYKYVTIYNDKLTSGIWSVSAKNGVKITDYTVLSIPTTAAKLSINDVMLSNRDQEVSVLWDANNTADIFVSLVPCDESGNPLIVEVEDENGNIIEAESAPYPVGLGIGADGRGVYPVNLPSGKYIVRLESFLNGFTFTSVDSDEVLDYVNPNTIGKPEVDAWGAGDGIIQIESTVPENSTGVYIQVYEKTDDEYRLLNGLGGYVGHYDDSGKVSTYLKGTREIVDENGSVIAAPAIVPGNTYRIEVIAQNNIAGSGFYASEPVMIEDITVPVPNPPEVKVSIRNLDDTELEERTSDTGVSYFHSSDNDFIVEYEITNLGEGNNDEVDVYFEINNAQYGDKVVNNSENGADGYATFNLTDGEHLFDIRFVNEAGDVYTYYKKLSVDSVAADLKVQSPISGSTYDAEEGIIIDFTTDLGADIKIELDGRTVITDKNVIYDEDDPNYQNGRYENVIPVAGTESQHEVKITVTDSNGNSTEYYAEVFDNRISKIEGIRIKAEMTEGSDAYELTAAAVDKFGKDLGIQIPSESIRWTLLSDPSAASITVDSANNSAVVIPSGDNPITVKAEWQIAGNVSFTDIFETGIVGEQQGDVIEPDEPKPDEPKPDEPLPDEPKPDEPDPDEPDPEEDEDSSFGFIDPDTIINITSLPKDVKNLIEKVRTKLSPPADVEAKKLYASVDKTVKQDGNVVFIAGEDIGSENYVVVGTDKNKPYHSSSIPAGTEIVSDVVYVTTLNPVDGMTIDLEVNKAAGNAGIFYHDEHLDKWIYVGGEYDLRKGMIHADITVGGKYAAISLPDKIFADTQGRWSELYIDSLAYAGIVSGYNIDGEMYFKPANDITRGEFIKILVSAKGVDLSSSDVSMFADADTIDEWLIPYAAAAAKLGWLKGSMTDKGLMANLGQKITRQDAMVLICRSFFDGEEAERSMNFTDERDISSYAYDAVEYLTDKNIVSGYDDNTVKPLDNVKREQVAKMLWHCILIAD